MPVRSRMLFLGLIASSDNFICRRGELFLDCRAASPVPVISLFLFHVWNIYKMCLCIPLLKESMDVCQSDIIIEVPSLKYLCVLFCISADITFAKGTDKTPDHHTAWFIELFMDSRFWMVLFTFGLGHSFS